MDARTCEKCKKIFQYSGYGPVYCPDCSKLDDEQMKAVKNYLEKHPGADGKEVSAITGASIETITGWMRDGRFITPDAINIGLKCQSCGKNIYKGILCDDCISGFKKELIDAADSKEEKRKIEKRMTGFKFMDDKKKR